MRIDLYIDRMVKIIFPMEIFTRNRKITIGLKIGITIGSGKLFCFVFYLRAFQSFEQTRILEPCNQSRSNSKIVKLH